MTNPTFNTIEPTVENIQTPTVSPQNNSNTVRILVIVVILMSVALVILTIMLLRANNGGSTDNTLQATPTTVAIKTTVTPTPSGNTPVVTNTPSATAGPTTAVQTKKVTLTGFNAEIYIPQGWNYTLEEFIGHQSGGYYFTNENGQATFDLIVFDGGVLENYCRDAGSVLSHETILIDGRTETISNCFVNNVFTQSYWWINQTFAYDSSIQLSDDIKTILRTINFTN